MNWNDASSCESACAATWASSRRSTKGRTYYVVKDPISLRYYRLKDNEHFLLQFMDGSHTLEDAQKAYEAQYRPDRLKLEDVEGFAQQLINGGLAQNESPRAGKQLYEQRKKRRRSEWMQTLHEHPLHQDPDLRPRPPAEAHGPLARLDFHDCGFSPLSVVLMFSAPSAGGRRTSRRSATSCRTITSSSVSRPSSICGAPWRWSR